MNGAAPPPLVSVITVCFNAARVLPRAIESLHAQRYPEREWVVVDGASTDGTQALVAQAPERPAAFVSEPDRGVYDAMNKAVALARGELLFFLNADDRLHDPEVLGDVAALFAADPGLDLVYGDVVVEKPGERSLKRANWINRGTLPFEDLCHQAVFAHRRLFEQVGVFDLRWPTSADYDWLLRVFRSPARVRYVARRVAVFAGGGMHTRDPAALVAERRAVRLQYMRRGPLAAGQLASRIVHRLSRTLRGGLWLGHHRLGGE